MHAASRPQSRHTAPGRRLGGHGPAAQAQQFNSDNYLSKPHGVATVILTAGPRDLMWMTTFSLFPKWEFTAAAYLFHEDNDRKAAT
jgi:hypothetical protein